MLLLYVEFKISCQRYLKYCLFCVRFNEIEDESVHEM